MAEQEQNRSELPTRYKLDEARKRGNVAKSLDVNSLAIMGCAIAVFCFFGKTIISGELGLFHTVLSNAYQNSYELSEITRFLSAILTRTFVVLTPLFMLMAIVAFAINFIQVGPVFSFTPLKPDFKRINPVEGFKRIFSKRLLVEALKSTLKLVVMSCVLLVILKASWPALLSTMLMDAHGILLVLGNVAQTLCVKLLVALALLCIFDFAYSRWHYMHQLKMSKREIKDEHKRREGDPRIKSRIRQLQREQLKRSQSLGKIKNSDVLITNPTHLAVAIQYEQQQLDAPVVIAKGAGLLAMRMRLIARQHGIPIVENKRLAKALFFGVRIDGCVPEEHYAVVAKILFWVYQIKGRVLPGRAV